MKKELNPVLQVLGVGWLLWVLYKYFSYHPEYFGTKGIVSAFSQASSVLTFLVLVGVFYLGWSLYQSIFKEKEKIQLKTVTPFKILGFFTLFLMLFANYWLVAGKLWKETNFLHANLSILAKLSLVYLFLGVLTLIAFGAGKKILNWMKLKEENILTETVFAIGLGLGIMMGGVFALGFNKMLSVIPLAIFFLFLIVVSYKECFLFLKRFFLETFEFEARFFSFKVLFLCALSFVLVLNAIDLMRPMPIGWDDMGVYLNFPKQMAGIKTLLQGSTNNYFLIASLPFVFIRDQFLAAMTGMFISYWGGFLMLLALAAFVGKFFKKEYALMTLVLIYIIPMTMHQSYADMKTDMTLFFFMLLSVSAFFNWFVQDLKHKKWLILAGVFAGIAFGIKPTAILLVFGILIGIFYRFWSWQGAVGIFLLEWVVLRYSGSLRLLAQLDGQLITFLMTGLLIIGLSFLVWGFWQKANLKKLILSVSVFLLMLGVVFLPWAVKNLQETNYVFAIGTLLNGRDNSVPRIDYKAIGVDAKTCKGTAHTEELDRYLGYDTGWGRYLTLPWKVTMNTTVHGFYLDLSFLFLSFMPLGFLVFYLKRKTEDQVLKQNWLVLIWMGVAAWLMWMLVGNGVIWYGIFAFVLILPMTAYFFYENETLALKILTGVMVCLSIFSVIALRGAKFGNFATIRYAYGINSGAESVELIVPDYAKIACRITGGKWNQNNKTCYPSEKPENSPVYRIGTFIPYFVPDNNHRLLNDAQLDTFKCIDDATGKNDLETMRKLYAAGYKYIIFDLNTATIEKDANGSLHQKANRFVEWVNNLSQQSKVYVHVYNPNKGIAFMEITPDEPLDPNNL